MWIKVEGMTDEVLVQHAIGRGLVRLRDGRIATLVSWPGRQKRRGRYCRLETRAGTRFSLRCDAVESMDVTTKGTE